MLRYAYDVECFPNLFTVTFVNIDDDKDVKSFYIGFDKKDYPELLAFLDQEMVLVGYNNHSYDDCMLRKLMESDASNITTVLHNLSGKLIDDNSRKDRSIIALRYPRGKNYKWKSVDLMRILAFDKIGISLKQTAINLKWHKIQDLPLEPTARVKPEELQMVMDYNLNDVLITKRLYEEISPIRKLREDLGKIYNVDLSSASDSAVANILLEKMYEDTTKRSVKEIKDRRTPRTNVALGDCIAKFVSFKSPELQELVKRISAQYVYFYQNYKYSDKIYYANCVFVLGTGGLHSEDEPGEFYTDSEYIIQDMDVASYYPNLIINNRFYPEHLGVGFISLLKKITNERLEAKHSGDVVKASGLKITINSIFGKFGLESFWLYDPKQLLSTTISGQLGLLMLVEKLHMAGIHVISANTDGVVCKIPRKLEAKYYEVAKEWEEETGLELEFTPYAKYIRRDVNSYITEKLDGSTKEKGAFLTSVDLKKAYRMPIVQKAIHAYFIDGVPVEKTLNDCKDIMEFCISQKTGSNFIVEFHQLSGITQLQKTNRYYISTKGGNLVKRDKVSGRIISLNVGKTAQILNDYDPSKSFEEYDVDLSFYQAEAEKVINEIRPIQMDLFSTFGIDSGRVSKMDSGLSNEAIAEQAKTVDELNRLGKNQFAKRIAEIVEAGETVDDISSKYIYVLDVHPTKKVIDFYVLAKGIRQTIRMTNSAYKQEGLAIGSILYCSRFEKQGGEFLLSSCKVVEKIETEEESLF